MPEEKKKKGNSRTCLAGQPRLRYAEMLFRIDAVVFVVVGSRTVKTCGWPMTTLISVADDISMIYWSVLFYILISYYEQLRTYI